MRKIIIAEKAIAAKRISDILSSGKAKQEKFSKKFSAYKWDGFVTVPLSGHIVQADFPPKYSSWSKNKVKDLLKADIIQNVSMPGIAKYLEKVGKNADEVIIATDNDREGELIGREGLEFVKAKNPKVKVRRALFSAITEEDIQGAFKNLKKLDDDLADSAEARRNIDLLWGAALTRLVSALGHRFGNSYLSVGRVQTPVLRMIVDRAKQRQRFKPEKYWELKAKLFKKKVFEAEHKGVFKDGKEVKKILSKNIKKMTVKSFKVSQRKVPRPAPFNTTAFLRTCHNEFGYSPANSMRIAEHLYVRGFISYPRTSNTVYPKSLNLKKILSKLSRQYEHAKDFIGKDLNPSRGSKKTTDHPPIHPVGLPKKIGSQEKKVYELIVKRFFATLSEDGLEKRTRIKFDAKGHEFVSNGMIITKKGWMKYYDFYKPKEFALPEMLEGDKVDVKKLWSDEKETQPPNRYGASTLLKIMDEKNLGTKSTRHSILQKIVYRGYVEPKTFEPNHIGFALIHILKKNCEDITNPYMTSELESEMEKIAGGKRSKDYVINHSKKGLLTAINKLESKEKVVSKELREALKEDLIICPCPKCGVGNMRVIRSRRTGKRFCGCSNYPKCSNGWPLPQKGGLYVTDKLCKDCGVKIVEIRYGRRPWRFCPNINCPGKKDKKT